MQQIFPLQLKQKFKCNILSAELIYECQMKKYYDCSTNFGKMTLIVQYLPIQSYTNQFIKKQIDSYFNPEQYFNHRNLLINDQQMLKYSTIIYQQYIIRLHKQKSACFTLIQPIQVIKINKKLRFQQYNNLILYLTQIQIKKPQFSILNLNNKSLKDHLFLKSKLTGKIYFDFTQLKYNSPNYQNPLKLSPQQLKKQQINKFLSYFYQTQNSQRNNNKQKQHQNQNQNLKQIIIIKDKVFKFQLKKLIQKQYQSWFQIAIALNLLQNIQVIIQVKQKVLESKIIYKDKISTIKNIHNFISQQNCIFQFKDKKYLNFTFIDGQSIDSLIQLNYQTLIQKFFVDQYIYSLKKSNYLTVQILNSNIINSKKDKIKTDRIFVKSGIQKIQCINFFITYFKYIEPIITKISFQRIENMLSFEFQGKSQIKRKVQIIFYPEYLVKDEELSMILEKSKLLNTELFLSKMLITDSFLMFLANFQKTKKIKTIDISYCQKITQNGISSFLISPFCRNLESLNLSGLPLIQSSIQSLNLKLKLKQLYLNNCQNQVQETQIIFNYNQNLIKLQALGLPIQPIFSQNLQFLKIDVQIPIECLKIFKDFNLKQLTLKLIQGKKNMIGILGNFYTKQINPIKIFAEGKPSKTLKLFDITGSSIKIKNLKSIFNFTELQTLILDNLKQKNEIDFQVSANLLNLSLKNSSFDLKQLICMLKNVRIMTCLNVYKTLLKRQQLKDFLLQNKKLINTLIISEYQFSNDLIEQNSQISQYIETFELICSLNIFSRYKQHILYQILYKLIKNHKILRFICQKPQQKQQFQNIAYKCIKNYLNNPKYTFYHNKIFIGQKSFRLINQKYIKNQINKTINNCEQYLCIHYHFKKPFYNYFNHQYFDSYYQINKQQSNKNKNQSYHLSQQLAYTQNLTISHLAYFLKKGLLSNQNQIIQISLKNNKLINVKDFFSMISLFFPSRKIKSINLKGTNILNPQLNIINMEQIMKIPFIQSINQNQYQILFDEGNFLEKSQQYMKFFMRIFNMKKLKIISIKIHQVQFLFQILFHMIDHHSESIQQLQCQFNQISMNMENSNSFWIKISQLPNLKSLSIIMKKQQIFQQIFYSSNSYFLKKFIKNYQYNRENKLIKLNVQGIDLECFPYFKHSTNLQYVRLNFSKYFILFIQIIIIGIQILNQ